MITDFENDFFYRRHLLMISVSIFVVDSTINSMRVGNTDKMRSI